MEKITIEELTDIVKSGKFEVLKEHVENEFFECKKELYRLNNDSIKRELAKDVSSFANSNGGYILIGIRTEKSSTHPFDVVKKISYLDKKSVDGKRYYNIIKDWVYPEIQGLSIFWVESNEYRNKGIFVIYIPKQKNFNKPFLITKEIEGRKKSEIIFGYAERKSDSSEPKDIRIIYSLMRKGLNYTQNIESRFDKIDTLLEVSKKEEKIKRLENLDQEISKRISDTLEVNNMGSKRTSMLIAYTESQNLLSSIFERKEGSIYKKLEHPDKLRYGGWDLETLDTPRIVEGKFIQACNGNRKIIRLYRDGVFLFVTDQSFWFWPKEDKGKLNCLAIIESVYNFVNFYKNVLKDFITPESSAFLKFGMFNYHQSGKESFLCEGSLKSFSFQYSDNPKYAPKDRYVSPSYLYNFSNLSVEAISYKIVKEIYLWFGIPEGDGRIPYTKVEEGVKMIDTEKIIKIK